METLSPLERELLTYVKQLTEASKHSSTVLSDLEKRSTSLLTKHLDDLETCLSASINLQTQFNAGLISLLTEPASFDEHTRSLNETMTSIESIQSKLNRNAH